MVNRAILVGRLGKDPELRYTSSGAAVATMSIATTIQWRDAEGAHRKQTDWHTVVAWNELGEAAAKHLVKGSLVYIEGHLRTRRWKGAQGTQSRTEVIVEQMRFLNSKHTAASIPEEDLPEDLADRDEE